MILMVKVKGQRNSNDQKKIEFSFFSKICKTIIINLGTMRYIVGFASWMAVCFIALSRCFTLICPETSFKLFTSPWGQFSVFFTTWTLAVAYISPILTEVKVA